MTGAAAGLGGGTTCVDEMSVKKVGERLGRRFSIVPHIILVMTDAAFELRRSLRELIMAYVGSPSIGGIVRVLKLLASLSTEVAVIVVSKQLINN